MLVAVVVLLYLLEVIEGNGDSSVTRGQRCELEEYQYQSLGYSTECTRLRSRRWRALALSNSSVMVSMLK